MPGVSQSSIGSPPPVAVASPPSILAEPLTRRLLVRSVGLGAVFLTELLVLTIRFDAEDLLSRPQWWLRDLVEASVLVHGLLAFSAAFLLVVSSRLRAMVRTLADESAEHRWAPWLSLQLATFGVLWVSTAGLFEGGSESVGLVVTWTVAAVMAGALGLFAVAPPRCWRAIARREPMALLVAATVGVVAVASGRLAQALWGPLAGATFYLVRRLLGAMYAHTVSDPRRLTVGTPAFDVEIAPGCSGYEGVALVLVFLAVYLCLFRRALRFPHALLLLPVGVVAIWSSNVLRITALIAIGTSVSPRVAQGGFHSQAGWLFFLAVSLGLMVASHRVRLFAAPASLAGAQVTRPRDTAEAAALLVPALVLLASGMVTSAVATELDWLYPLRVVATAAALWHFRAAYRKLWCPWTWQSVAIGGAVFVLWLALEPNAPGLSGIESGLARLSGGAAGLWLAFRVIGSTITVPLAEELAFRGYLIRKLVSPAFETVRPGHFTWLSFVLSSILFGLLHGRWLAGTLAGMAFALALYRRGQVGEAVYAHMTANALIAGYVLAFGRWSLWS
jgi:exosortase E/protease (VPEID-CTERM system)